MSAIKDFLVDLLEDLTTIEVATFRVEEEGNAGPIISSYTRMESGGDAVHFFDPTLFSAESQLPALHHELVVTAVGARKVLREILIAALKQK